MAQHISTDGTNIPGPYINPEETESLPLKRYLYGNAHTAARGCCYYFTGDDGGVGSLRTIVSFFFILTVAVTIALAIQIHYGDYELVPHGSVATDSHKCSVLGTDILKQGGNAVDAAIASTLCVGIFNPHVTGLGGGGFMLIYNHRKQQVLDVLDFRESAPSSWVPGLSVGAMVGIPGLLKGLGLAHQLYGKLSWKDLVMPSVEIARVGIQVPSTLVAAHWHLGNSSENAKLRELLDLLEAGQNLPLSSLANTLELVALQGPEAFYNGSLADDILSTISNAGGIMTAKDLSSYQPIRRPAHHIQFSNFDLYVPGPPAAGLFLDSVLKALQDNVPNSLPEPPDSVHLARTIETVYATHLGFWGDPSFLNNTSNQSEINEPLSDNFWNFPEAVGSHVAAVDLDDLYVSVVSGLNTWYGSQLLTDGGFILNNALKNFGTGSNSPAPGKRPFTLAVPIIAVQHDQICGRRLVLGAGDATVAIQLLMRLLAFGDNATLGVEAPRFRVASGGTFLQLEGWHEPLFGKATLDTFTGSGFKLHLNSEPYQSVNVVEKYGDTLTSHSDSRGGGLSSRF